MADRDDAKAETTTVEKVEAITNVLSSGTMNSDEPLQTNEDAHLTLKQSLVKWRRVVVYSLCMTSGILMFGYDYVIIGTVSAMPSFQYAVPPFRQCVKIS